MVFLLIITHLPLFLIVKVGKDAHAVWLMGTAAVSRES